MVISRTEITEDVHRTWMLTAMGAGFGSATISVLAYQFIRSIGELVAHHVAGVAILVTLGIAMAVILYGLLHFAWSKYRKIVWGGGLGSLTLGTVGVLLVLLPAQAVVHKMISVDRLMDVELKGAAIHIQGAISQKLPDRIEPLIEKGGQYFVFGNNTGGFIRGTFKAWEVIEAAGIDTAVIAGDCESSCAYLAILFKHRLLAPGARLGFHDLHAAVSDGEAAVARDRERLTRTLMRNGYSQALIDELLSTKEIAYYDQTRLIEDGLITGCWSPETKSAVDC